MVSFSAKKINNLKKMCSRLLTKHGELVYHVFKEIDMTIKPIMKPSDIDPDGVSSIMLYPAERVREIFSRAKAARGTGREAEEFRVFFLRMERLYDRYSFESNTCLEEEDALRWAAVGEAAEDAEFTASIKAAR
jgi:hypothetical protein